MCQRPRNMATSMKTSDSVLHKFFLYADSSDKKILLTSLTDTRNYIRGRHSRTKIKQFRTSGGLEVLVKLLRDNVSSSTSSTQQRNDQDSNNKTNDVTRPGIAKLNVTVRGGKPTPSSSTATAHRNAEVKRKVDWVKKETTRIDILTMCVSILATCCTEADCRMKVKNTGYVTVLAKVLRHETDEGVINRAARAIANLAKLAELSACFHKQEFIPCLIKHLHTSEDSNTKYSLVRALKVLADTSDHCLAIIYSDGIKGVLKSLACTDENLVGLSMETLAELTHPYKFNHLKKPSWRMLWEAVGSQAAEAVDLVLNLIDMEKPSVSDQALSLLNNLMNSKAVRLAVGRLDKIPEFVKLCSSSDIAATPYLQCLAICCKESVNRAKVKQSDGLDVFVKVLKTSQLLYEKHIAIAGLVHFYHDEMALRYLCTIGMIECLKSYLESYIQQNLEVPSERFVKPNYNFERSLGTGNTRISGGEKISNEVRVQLSGTRRDPSIPLTSHSQQAHEIRGSTRACVKLFATKASRDLISLHSSKDEPCDSSRMKKNSEVRNTSVDAGPAIEKESKTGSSMTSSRCERNSVEAAGAKNTSQETVVQFKSSDAQSFEGESKTPLAAQDPASATDADPYEEFSVILDHSPSPYSPPSVDWSSVFALREQQGYRGLSPQSNLSSCSDSPEREIPKYQYALDRSLSPYSDTSWQMAEHGEEVQYSPVVSDEEEDTETSTSIVPKQTTPTKGSVPPTVDTVGYSLMVPSTSREVNLSPSSSVPNTSKRSRSSSVDSSYESEVLDDLSLEDDTSKPEGYALHLIYKCSSIDETLETLADFDVIDVLLKLVLYCTQFQSKCTKILYSIIGSQIVFEKLVTVGVPLYLETAQVDVTSEDSEVKGVCGGHPGTTSRGPKFGSTDGQRKKRKFCQHKCGAPHSCSFLNKLSEVAESSFGIGAMDHMLNSTEISKKMAAYDALSILCRSQDSLKFHLIKCNTLQQLDSIFRSPAASSAEKAILVRCLRKLSQSVEVGRGSCDSVIPSKAEEQLCKRRSSLSPRDIKLLVDDDSFVLANRELLVESSKYFQCMLQGCYKESTEDIVRVTDISRAGLEVIIHHLYGCSWRSCTAFDDVTLETGMEILSAAGKFLLPELQESITDYCLKEKINSETVCNICLFSIAHGCRSLWRHCLEFMLIDESVKVDSFAVLSSSLFGDESFQEIISIIKDAARRLS